MTPYPTFTTILHKVPYQAISTFVMLFFQGELTLESRVDIYQLVLHPILLNLQAWCVILLDIHEYNTDVIIQLHVPEELTTFQVSGIRWSGGSL